MSRPFAKLNIFMDSSSNDAYEHDYTIINFWYTRCNPKLGSIV